MATANIVGAGPNGLAAAITLAQRGVRPVVWERAARVGGGVSSEELTLPGFVHDVCSAVYPLGVASPFFAGLGLERHGLRWVQPEAALAHPLEDGSAVMLERSMDETAAGLGAADGQAWRELLRPLVFGWEELLGEILGPVAHVPRHPLLLARFGMLALQPAERLARAYFQGERARAVFAGCAAHAVLPLTAAGSSAIALVMGAAAHTTGWPIVQGGAQRLADALAAEVIALGGEIHTGAEVRKLSALPEAELTLCDVTPRQLAAMARLPEEYRARMLRYKYGPGVVKVDWALGEAIPWRAKECARAATVHVGGTLEEIAAWEAAAFAGKIAGPGAAKPFAILVQPSLFDATRAPAGKHTAWAYCHVPQGWDGDAEAMADAVERQVERFAPGFRECVLARRVQGTRAMEARNPNLVGGDISGGAMTLRQLVLRPTAALYRTPLDGVYLCSSSTPPGGGVHGMCGHLAARLALRRMGRS